MWGLWVLLGLAVLAMTSGGIALALHLFRPGSSRRRRILWSAAITALLPSAIVFGGFLFEALPAASEARSELVLGFLALLFGALVLFAVICLPPAWLVTARLGRGEDEDGDPMIEDDGNADPALTA